MTKYCEVCQVNGRTIKAMWEHPKEKHAEKMCDGCYQAQVKWYAAFRKIKKSG